MSARTGPRPLLEKRSVTNNSVNTAHLHKPKRAKLSRRTAFKSA